MPVLKMLSFIQDTVCQSTYIIPTKIYVAHDSGY